jgi:hypothetical protein
VVKEENNHQKSSGLDLQSSPYISLRKVALDVLDKIKYVENTSVFYVV